MTTPTIPNWLGEALASDRPELVKLREAAPDFLCERVVPEIQQAMEDGGHADAWARSVVRRYLVAHGEWQQTPMALEFAREAAEQSSKIADAARKLSAHLNGMRQLGERAAGRGVLIEDLPTGFDVDMACPGLEERLVQLASLSGRRGGPASGRLRKSLPSFIERADDVLVLSSGGANDLWQWLTGDLEDQVEAIEKARRRGQKIPGR